MREVGIMSMLEDFGGEELSTLRTSSAETGDCVENRPMMRGKGHVGRQWHRQRAQCIINAISKPGYLVSKESSEGSAENTILIISRKALFLLVHLHICVPVSV